MPFQLNYTCVFFTKLHYIMVAILDSAGDSLYFVPYSKIFYLYTTRLKSQKSYIFQEFKMEYVPTLLMILIIHFVSIGAGLLLIIGVFLRRKILMIPWLIIGEIIVAFWVVNFLRKGYKICPFLAPKSHRICHKVSKSYFQRQFTIYCSHISR